MVPLLLHFTYILLLCEFRGKKTIIYCGLGGLFVCGDVPVLLVWVYLVRGLFLIWVPVASLLCVLVTPPLIEGVQMPKLRSGPGALGSGVVQAVPGARVQWRQLPSTAGYSSAFLKDQFRSIV